MRVGIGPSRHPVIQEHGSHGVTATPLAAQASPAAALAGVQRVAGPWATTPPTGSRPFLQVGRIGKAGRTTAGDAWMRTKRTVESTITPAPAQVHQSGTSENIAQPQSAAKTIWT